MTRRGIAAVALVVFVSGCTGDGAEPTTPTTQPPSTTTTTFGGSGTVTTESPPDPVRVGGTLRLDMIGSHVSVNVGFAQASGWLELFRTNLLPSTYRFDGTGQTMPDLLVEMPTIDNGSLVVNPDGTLTASLEIHPDATWSDGVPVSGHDFEFSIRAGRSYADRFASVALVRQASAELRDELGRDPTVEEAAERSGVDEELTRDVLEGAYSVTNTCGQVEPLTQSAGLEAVEPILLDSMVAGPKSFQYTVRSPADYFPLEAIIPAHSFEGADLIVDWVDRLWPSAGPFAFESFDASTGEVTLVRNEHYWRTDEVTGAQLPLVDRIIAGRHPELRRRLPTQQAVTFFDGTAEVETVADLRELDRLIAGCGIEGAFQVFPVSSNAEAFAIFFAWEDAVAALRLELAAEGVIVELDGLDGREVQALREQYGIEATVVSSAIWEHLGFHFGDNRLRANPDSLVEHVEFRRAIAHALDRDRIAAEAPEFPGLVVDGIVEVLSSTLTVPGGLPYSYDPDRARQLVVELCAELDRDCESNPPTLVFSTEDQPFRLRTYELIAEMLGEVGIEVVARPFEGGIFDLLWGCDGWETATWAWISTATAGLANAYQVLNPSAPVIDANSGNPYAWGTGVQQGIPDEHLAGELGPTPDCDESTVYNQGPSSVRNEFTERFATLMMQLQQAVDDDRKLAVINELETIIADQVVIIPLYARPFGFYVNESVVGGSERESGAVSPYFDLEQWYLIDPAT